MQFTARLREPIMRGEITCSVRIWQKPHVNVGGRTAELEILRPEFGRDRRSLGCR